MDDLLQKWKARLDQVFEQQLMDLLINQHIFKQLVECIEPYVGTRTGAHLAEWMAQGYVAFAATAIRRMVDGDNRSLSLVILLRDIRNAIRGNPSLFVRSWFAGRYTDEVIRARCADQHFARVTQDTSAEALTADRVQKDINVVKRATEPVRQLVNKTIAHTDRDGAEVRKHMYRELNDAIAELTEVYRRYSLLITGSCPDPLVPLDVFDVRDDLKKVWPESVLKGGGNE